MYSCLLKLKETTAKEKNYRIRFIDFNNVKMNNFPFGSVIYKNKCYIIFFLKVY